jgi:hydroxymethylpyrimidine/phosphomethylpyrimidine kinase
MKTKGEYHGTGCAFSAALTALLALGHIPLESVRRAKEFVNNAIKKLTILAEAWDCFIFNT